MQARLIGNGWVSLRLYRGTPGVSLLPLLLLLLPPPLLLLLLTAAAATAAALRLLRPLWW
jgi:hypothetical protein